MGLTAHCTRAAAARRVGWLVTGVFGLALAPASALADGPGAANGLVDLDLVASGPGLVLSLATIPRNAPVIDALLRAHPTRIGPMPSRARVAPGYYGAIVTVDDDPIPVDLGLAIDGPARLTADVVSRAGTRAVGLGLALAGAACLLGSLAMPFLLEDASPGALRYAFWGTMTLGLALGSTSLFLAFTPDEVTLRLEPR